MSSRLKSRVNKLEQKNTQTESYTQPLPWESQDAARSAVLGGAIPWADMYSESEL